MKSKCTLICVITFIFSLGAFLILLFSNSKKEIISSPIKHPLNNKDIANKYSIHPPEIPKTIQFANENIPLNNDFVHDKLDRELIVNMFWHSQTILFLKRAHRYFPIIEPILKKNNIPDDFKYLTIIESGLQNVTSPSGAKGYWQFMRKTAIEYGLEVSIEVDERNHIEKSTQAACNYIKTAYNKFNNWILAAAAYNMGVYGLEKQIERQKTSNYFNLLLNNETSRYIFRLIAVKQIFTDPVNYGFIMDDQDLYDPYQTKIIKVDTSIVDLVSYASYYNTNYNTLKTLNPWLISNQLINEHGKKYLLKIPKNNAGLEVIKEATE